MRVGTSNATLGGNPVAGFHVLQGVEEVKPCRLVLDENAYRGVLYIHDASLSVTQVADIVHAVSEHYPQDETDGLVYIGEEWF